MTRVAQAGARRPRPGGRTARVRAAVLAAARELLVEGGPEAVTFTEVARRAGVQRSSLYRRYRTPERLLRELAAAAAADAIPIPDTGSLVGDLAALLTMARKLLVSPLGRALAGAGLGTPSPEALNERRRYWRTRLDRLSVVMERAVARGELDRAPSRTAFAFVLGPLWFRMFVSAEPMRPRDLTELARLAAVALGAHT